jgi:hypothetical protein
MQSLRSRRLCCLAAAASPAQWQFHDQHIEERCQPDRHGRRQLQPTITIEEKQQSAAKSLSPTEAKRLSDAFRALDPKPSFLSREMVEHNAL